MQPSSSRSEESGELGDVPGAGASRGVDWDALPEPVRERLAGLAATAMGGLPAADLPRQLRPVARFAPAKRARVGAAALLAGLRDSPRFRTGVAEWLRSHRPEDLDVADDDPVGRAAVALLLGRPEAAERVRSVAEHAEEAELRAERDAALARVHRLEAELAEVRAELAEARADVDRVRDERTGQLDKLRARLRAQGTELRQAKDAAEQARKEAESARSGHGGEAERLAAERDKERERAEAERARADRAVADAETARRAAREAREADEVRLRLLLDTLGGAVDGLRRELSVDVSGGDTRGTRPADTVHGAKTPRRGGERVADADALDRLLALPAAHLIVDGYNVTKTGYPELPLADQRSRLIGQLGALKARVGAETTVVFDGAGVTAIPAVNPRGVRVLFSEPGVLADDVIRDLVAAEPRGRPLVVVTSDQEIVTSVRRSGAHAVPSAVFLARLS